MTEERLPLQKVMVSLPSVRHNFGSYMTKNVTKKNLGDFRGFKPWWLRAASIR